MVTTPLKRGETLQHSITLTDANGTAVDLSGATATSSLVAELDGTAVAALSVTEVSYSAGQFTIVISSTVSADLDLHKVYYYDAKFVKSGVTYYTDTYAIRIEGRATA